MSKIAYTLYRVSTKKQLYTDSEEKTDIPMQRKSCCEFADRMGWEIGREFEEKGISGFKVSADNRDAIQDLKEAALKGEFQILLVFMFDCIGRIDDETPFVVKSENEWNMARQALLRLMETENITIQELDERCWSNSDKIFDYIFG